MSLTESLLAWIAEDEAETFQLVPYDCEPNCCAPAGWVGHRCLICGTTEFGGTVSAITEVAREHAEKIHRRPRVLAECEAKRQAIRAAWQDHLHIEGEWMCRSTETLEADNDQPMVVRYLAQPYANRPDFQEDWKE